MSWWTSVSDSVYATKDRLLNGAKWVWDNASLSKISSGLFTFTVNTTFHAVEEVLALRQAVPTLVHNPKARKVVNGMAYVLAHDVLPAVAVYCTYNGINNYCRDGYDEKQASFMSAAFLQTLSLGGYLVNAYLWKQGAQTVMRTGVLDTFAPAAFNSNKIKEPPSLCIEKECNNQRKLKGMGRELFILLANDALIAGISYLPYVGGPSAAVLSVLNNGRYITRTATPERCERHKFMEQEFVVSVGLLYELTSWLMDKGLNATTGPLPFIYIRTLRHMLLALHVNIAAHMKIPLVQAKDATIPMDLFNNYEGAWRFSLDVIWSGLLKNIPIYFKPEPGVPPLILLSTILRLSTRVLNHDLEREDRLALTYSDRLIKSMKDWILPPMFRSAYDFTRDPVLAPYWADIREGGIATIKLIESYGKTNMVATLAIAPKSVAVLLDLKFGIPAKLTRILLMLSKEQEVWELISAIRGWFERHNLRVDIKLVASSSPLLALCGDKPLEAIPVTQGRIEQVVPVTLLDKTPRASEVVDAGQLLPQRAKRTEALVSVSADALFGTRRRKAKAEVRPLQIEVIEDYADGVSSPTHA